MNLLLPVCVIAVPFAAAVALAVIPSWRIGVWITAGSATVVFLLACALPWFPPPPPLASEPASILLAMLTGLVAMLTGWLDRRDVARALAARTLDRRRTQLAHIALQITLGALLLAILADAAGLRWLGLAVAVAAIAVTMAVQRRPAAVAAASRLLLACGVGLMLALLGTALLVAAPVPAAIFLLLGYGALAGLVPLHAWLPDAVSESLPQGAILITLLANVPLLQLARLPAGLLMAGGLASLLLGALLLSGRACASRNVSFAGVAQLGMVVFAFGVGGPAEPVGWLHMTLLTLTRAAALHGERTPGIRRPGLVALAVLPILVLALIAAPTGAWSVWLLLPLAAGAMLMSWFVLDTLPVQAT